VPDACGSAKRGVGSKRARARRAGDKKIGPGARGTRPSGIWVIRQAAEAARIRSLASRGEERPETPVGHRRGEERCRTFAAEAATMTLCPIHICESSRLCCSAAMQRMHGCAGVVVEVQGPPAGRPQACTICLGLLRWRSPRCDAPLTVGTGPPIWSKQRSSRARRNPEDPNYDFCKPLSNIAT
jgi:hypothetical protein